MTDSDSIPNPMEDETVDEKTLGKEAKQILTHSEQIRKRLNRDIPLYHQDIIAFGQKLQLGRDHYFGNDTGFGDWVIRNKLNLGMGETQQERTACMTIARLHEDGFPHPEEPDQIAGKLDLTDCKRIRPTDIVKWARENQSHLFPKRANKNNDDKKKPLEDNEDQDDQDPNDEMPDLGGGGEGKAGDSDLIVELTAKIALQGAIIEKLVAKIKALCKQLGEDPEEILDAISPLLLKPQRKSKSDKHASAN